MSSSSSSFLQSPGSIGAWFCQISSGRWQGVRVEIDEPSACKNAGGKSALKEDAKAAAAVETGDKASAVTTSSCRGGASAAMPEATVCLLLDRFAPS